jgi:DNA replication and repair protein RecF
MVMSFEPRHADAVLSYEKAMRERNRLLKDMVRDAHWYAALEAQMATSGALIMQNRLMVLERLKEAQDGAETAFPVAQLTLKASDRFDLPETEIDLLAAFKDNRPRDLAAGRTLIGPHRADLGAVYTAKDVTADQCSTGEQKALLISLILANGRALAQDFGAAPIFLLDEVAAHLDAGRRAALYDEISALGAQAFMTGTGPELFAELGHRAATFEVSDDHGISSIRQIQ